MFSVKGSTSNRSWLGYNSFLTAMYDTIKCEDDMYIQTAVSNRTCSNDPSNDNPIAVFLLTLKRQIKRIIMIIFCFKV